MPKQRKYSCAVEGNLGRFAIGRRVIGAVCPKWCLNNDCGAHGNKKCKHKVLKQND